MLDKVGDQELGLNPNGHDQAMTGPVGYYDGNVIKKCLQLLLEAGAQTQQEVKHVGGGKLIASVMAQIVTWSDSSSYLGSAHLA